MSFPIWYSPPPPRHYQLMYAQNIIIIYIVYIIVYISIHVSYGEMSLQTQMPMQVFLCLSVCTSHHVTSVISSGEKPMSVNSSYLQALHVTGQVVYSGSQIISHALNCLWGEVAEALWLPWRRKLKKKKNIPSRHFTLGVCLSFSGATGVVRLVGSARLTLAPLTGEDEDMFQCYTLGDLGELLIEVLVAGGNKNDLG